MSWLNAHPKVKKAISSAVVAGIAAIAQQLLTHIGDLPTYLQPIVQPLGAAGFTALVHWLAPWGTVNLAVEKPPTQEQSP